MLLSIDIGNSMVTMGVFNDEQMVTTLRLASDARRLDDEYGLLITNLLHLNGVERSQIDDICLCSVVPPLTPIFRTSCPKILWREAADGNRWCTHRPSNNLR